MFTRIELTVAAVVVVCVVVAVYLVQDRQFFSAATVSTQAASVAQSNLLLGEAITVATENKEITYMKVHDIKTGEGASVQAGDTVVVHYVGTFPDGQEFDSSKKRGVPFEFTVGAGQVIAGWEQGLIGMQEGGERTLVVPPELAYGERGIGPIPGGATLLFTIELLEIKE